MLNKIVKYMCDMRKKEYIYEMPYQAAMFNFYASAENVTILNVINQRI